LVLFHESFASIASFEQLLWVFKMNMKIDNPTMGFWDQKSILLVIFMLQATSINAEVYCATLRRLRRAIHNLWQGLLSSAVMPLCENACSHAAARMQAILPEFGWEVFDNPAYSPNLAPSDFHLFPTLKEFWFTDASKAMKK
jgi:hypothetical protein